MEYSIVDNNTNYKVVSEKESPEQLAKLFKAIEIFTDVQEEYNIKKAQYDEARYQMEKMFSLGSSEIGLKSVKSKYLNITYVPATEGTVKKEKILNESKLIEDLESLGLSIDDYYIFQDKVTGKRKESIRVTNND